MANLIVPYIEINRLTKLILQSFQKQTGIEILPTSVKYGFIPPRQTTKAAFELRDKTTSGIKTLIRTYIEFYEFDTAAQISPFRQEEIVNTPGGDGTQTYVCYALLPRTEYPGLYKFINVPDPDDLGSQRVSFDNTHIYFDSTEYTMDNQE